MSEPTENVEKYVDKSVDTGKIEAEEEPVKVEKPDKADAEPEIPEDALDSVTLEDGEVVKPKNFGNRIKQLTDKVRSIERVGFELRAENERLNKELKSKPDVQEPLKSLEDFEFNEAKYHEYQDQRTASIAEKAASSAVGKVQTQLESGRIEEAFRARESAFESEVSDYQEVVYGEVDGKRTWAASDEMRDEIRVSEIGPAMAYYLAKTSEGREIASEISTLSDRETVRRMTRLEDSIKSEKAKKGKSVSEAPPPTPELPKGEEGLDKDPSSMSDSEFAKWRRKQIANR